jgi:hypothetical protein
MRGDRAPGLGGWSACTSREAKPASARRSVGVGPTGVAARDIDEFSPRRRLRPSLPAPTSTRKLGAAGGANRHDPGDHHRPSAVTRREGADRSACSGGTSSTHREQPGLHRGRAHVPTSLQRQPDTCASGVRTSRATHPSPLRPDGKAGPFGASTPAGRTAPSFGPTFAVPTLGRPSIRRGLGRVATATIEVAAGTLEANGGRPAMVVSGCSTAKGLPLQANWYCDRAQPAWDLRDRLAGGRGGTPPT